MEKKIRRKAYKRKMKLAAVFLCLTMFLLGLLCGKLVFAKEESSENIQVMLNEKRVDEAAENRININDGRNDRENGEGEDWKLVLVNADHYMEEDYVPSLAEIENGYYFDARAVEDLKEMLETGREEGLDFWICSAYRTMEKQISLYEDKVIRLMSEECFSYDEAYQKAGNTIAVPGTSEHQIGLAVDIVAKDYQILDEKQAETEEAKWLKEHCYEYGFILRYPLDKIEETGIIFEPWHYRYVGRDAAKEIMDRGICLEEYLQDGEL